MKNICEPFIRVVSMRSARLTDWLRRSYLDADHEILQAALDLVRGPLERGRDVPSRAEPRNDKALPPREEHQHFDDRKLAQRLPMSNH